jgi:hypothetical protein
MVLERKSISPALCFACVLAANLAFAQGASDSIDEQDVVVMQPVRNGPEDSIRIEMPGVPSQVTVGEELDLHIRIRAIGSIPHSSPEPELVYVDLRRGWQLISGDTLIMAHIDRGYDETFVVRVRPSERERFAPVRVRVYSGHVDSAQAQRLLRRGHVRHDELYSNHTDAAGPVDIYNPLFPEPPRQPGDTAIVTVKSITTLQPPPFLPTTKAVVDSGGQIFYPPAIPPPDTLSGRPR